MNFLDPLTQAAKLIYGLAEYHHIQPFIKPKNLSYSIIQKRLFTKTNPIEIRYEEH